MIDPKQDFERIKQWCQNNISIGNSIKTKNAAAIKSTLSPTSRSLLTGIYFNIEMREQAGSRIPITDVAHQLVSDGIYDNHTGYRWSYEWFEIPNDWEVTI